MKAGVQCTTVVDGMIKVDHMLVQATDEAVVIADVPIHQIELHQLRATKKCVSIRVFEQK